MDQDKVKAAPAKSKAAQCEDCDSLKEIRHSMCVMIRPPTRVMAIAGYFPHLFTEDYQLSTRFCCFPVIWSLYILVTTIGKVIGFSLLRSTLFPHLQSLSSTEQFCNQLLFFTLYSTSCFLKVKAIMKRKEMASFWSRTCSLLQQFCAGDNDFNLFSPQGKYHNYLYKNNCTRVKTAAWVIVACSIMIPILQTLEHPSKLSNHQGLEGPPANKTALALPEYATSIMLFVLRFTSSFTHLHTSFVAFIIVFVKTYAAGLEIILSEMKETVSQLQDASFSTSIYSAVEARTESEQLY